MSLTLMIYLAHLTFYSLMTTIQHIHVQFLGPKCEGQANVRTEMSEEETHLGHTTTRTYLLREENHVSSKLSLHLQVRRRIISHKMSRTTNVSYRFLLYHRIQRRRRLTPFFVASGPHTGWLKCWDTLILNLLEHMFLQRRQHLHKVELHGGREYQRIISRCIWN